MYGALLCCVRFSVLKFGQQIGTLISTSQNARFYMQADVIQSLTTKWQDRALVRQKKKEIGIGVTVTKQLKPGRQCAKAA